MNRPWICPEDVREYSGLSDVKNRSDAQLLVDIRRAEGYIVRYVNHAFSDERYAAGVPEDVRVADLVLSEYFSHNSAANGTAKRSESFDDYSYTAEDSFIELKSLGIEGLLQPFVAAKASGKATMRLRRL